jgi:hypothetical protein
VWCLYLLAKHRTLYSHRQRVARIVGLTRNLVREIRSARPAPSPTETSLD